MESSRNIDREPFDWNICVNYELVCYIWGAEVVMQTTFATSYR